VSAKLLKSTGNITLVIDNLEKRGLVRYARESQDRRTVTKHITAEGRALVVRIFLFMLQSFVMNSTCSQ
jgi:MarR family 2-MHQ and catechol resistance regulon transcriptional repressor